MKVERVLSIEDAPASTMDIVESLRDEGLVVQEARTITEARIRAESEDFDLILLDARVPDFENFEQDAGVSFIRDLKSNAAKRNAGTPFILLTSFTHEIDANQVRTLPGFLAMFNKSSLTGDALEEILGFPLPLSSLEDPHEFVVEDLLVSERGEIRGGRIGFLVPAWESNEEVWIALADLPDDIVAQLGWGDLPFFMWARVNIAANVAEEVEPRSFRMYTGGGVDSLDD